METVVAASPRSEESFDKPGWCSISFDSVSGLQSGESRLRLILTESDARRLARNIAQQLAQSAELQRE